MKTHLTAVSPQQSLVTKEVIDNHAFAMEVGDKLRGYRSEFSLSVDQCARLLRKTSKEIVALERGRITFVYPEMAMEVVANRYGTSPSGVKKFRDKYSK